MFFKTGFISRSKVVARWSITIIFLLPVIILSQSVHEQFVSDYLNGRDISKYIDKDELTRSKRLGIAYENIQYKFLTAYDLDEDIKPRIIDKEVKYSIVHNKPDGNYQQSVITADMLKYKRVFTFKNNKLVGNFTYYSKDWKTIGSKYFIFKISDSTNFNKYCLEALDSYVDSLCVLLQISNVDKDKLEREKIYYYLLKDEDELDKYGEHRSAGYYSPDYDEIVTYTRAHYHEVAHALLTYKLKKQKYFTHPFIREGFAAAFGGALLLGTYQMSQSAASDFAVYVLHSGMVAHDSLFTLRGFAKYDFVGVSYPISGLFNRFLMQNFGLYGYLKLYRENSSEILADIDQFKVLDLPVSFKSFLNKYENSITLLPDSAVNDGTPVITEDDDEYFLNINGYVFFTPQNDALVNFRSTIFSDRFQGKQPKGERYYFFTNKYGIRIVDLYLDIIIADYIIPLDKSRETEDKLKVLSGFKIKKSFFSGNLISGYVISQVK